MGHVIAFPNQHAMKEYLAEASEKAKAGLHPVQDQISYGDHWIQVVDVRTRHVVFGQVHTLGQIRQDEIDHGATKTCADQAVGQTQADLENGLMYGRAFDRFDPDGELGYTHKSSVWPVDESVFLAAHEANFHIDEMGLPAQINMQIAWMAHRAWIVGKQV